MATGISFRDYIRCEFCRNPFEKGTGHLCFCSECNIAGKSSRHPMCDSCYNEALKNKTIKNINYNKNNMSDDLKFRLR